MEVRKEKSGRKWTWERNGSLRDGKVGGWMAETEGAESEKLVTRLFRENEARVI